MQSWILVAFFVTLIGSAALGRREAVNSTINEVLCRQLCLLSPETMEGPYYVPDQKIRSNMSEDYPGIPLEIRLVLKDYRTCEPLSNVRVDIWHANDKGIYSGKADFNTLNETFCRGVQLTDSEGAVTFRSIYPGWYEGRAIHVHIETFLSDKLKHIGQLYFPNSLTYAVSRRSPYKGRWTKPIPNEIDWIYRNQGGVETVFNVGGSPDSVITGTLELGIDTTLEIKPDEKQTTKITG